MSGTYSIVEAPGLDTERTTTTGLTYPQAMRIVTSDYTHRERRDGFVSIMKELPDGSLTMEY